MSAHARVEETIRRPVPGEAIDGYVIVRLWASGGMGDVYLAQKTRVGGFSRRFALKVMHPHLALQTSFVSMFLDEARIAGHIDHPHVVRVLDTGVHHGLPWLVMDFVEGVSLAELARGGAAASSNVRLAVLAQAAEGLMAAHEAIGAQGEPLGIVHRDVSPENILVGTDGRARVTDFGIAAARGRLTQTETGELKGKVGYLPPERFERSAKRDDPRADVWAFGVTAWEVLAERRLFGDADVVERMERIRHAPIPSLRTIAAGLSDALVDALEACLARDPEARPRSLGDAHRALCDELERAGGASRADISRAVRAAMPMHGNPAHEGTLPPRDETSEPSMREGAERSLEGPPPRETSTRRLRRFPAGAALGRPSRSAVRAVGMIALVLAVLAMLATVGVALGAHHDDARTEAARSQDLPGAPGTTTPLGSGPERPEREPVAAPVVAPDEPAVPVSVASSGDEVPRARPLARVRREEPRAAERRPAMDAPPPQTVEAPSVEAPPAHVEAAPRPSDEELLPSPYAR